MIEGPSGLRAIAPDDARPVYEASRRRLVWEQSGERRGFALVKRYQSGAQSYDRPITRPVAGSLRAAVGGVEIGAYAFADGVVTFAAPPSLGAVVTAGYEFDTPVRFDTDSLRVNLASFRAGDIPSIPLIETLE